MQSMHRMDHTGTNTDDRCPSRKSATRHQTVERRQIACTPASMWRLAAPAVQPESAHGMSENSFEPFSELALPEDDSQDPFQSTPFRCAQQSFRFYVRSPHRTK